MKNAVILHGTGGSSTSNWFMWLAGVLRERGLEVYVPDLPNASYPSAAEWTSYIQETCPFTITIETLLVGHSAGAVAVLLLAQQLGAVGRIVSVAAFKDLMYFHDHMGWHGNDRFLDIPFNFTAIQAACEHITFLHANDDPYCPLAHAEYLAVQTNGRLEVLQNFGHFNTEKGPQFTKLPEILPFILV